MVAVMVRAGFKTEFKVIGILAAFPVTIMTAMVSPIARPMPSMTAIEIPERAAGATTCQMVCQRVAPIARAASL
jgi:hypothetical protein